MKEEEEEKGVKKNNFPYHRRAPAVLERFSAGVLTLAEKIKDALEIKRIADYFGRNWGASFIAIFVLLMILSVVFFDLTAVSLASEVAVYGTTFLILGIAVQALSYLYYRNYPEKKTANTTKFSYKPSSLQQELRWVRGDRSEAIFGGEPTSRIGNELGVTYRLNFFSDIMPLIDRKKFVIDLGMGYGGYLKALSDSVTNMVGVEADLSYLSASVMKEVSVCSTIENLPIRDNSCSLALFFEVLEHVANEDDSLDSIRRALSRGGFLILTVPNRFHLLETHGFQFEGKTIRNLGGIGIPLLSLAPHSVREKLERARIYTQKELTTMLQSHGFRVIRIGYMPFIFGAVRENSLTRSARLVLNKICEYPPFKQMSPTCMIIACVNLNVP